jgi:AraC-like DNA-binding protein
MGPTRSIGRGPAKAEGFSGQVMHVIPRPLLARAARHVLVRPLHVTDIGWYPRARHHYKERPEGAGQHILILCVGGAGWCEVRGRRETVRAGEAVLVPKGAPHAYGADRRRPWSIHWAHFDGNDAAPYLQRMPEGTSRIAVDPAARRRMVDVFRTAYGALRGGYAEERLVYLSHAMRHLLGLLFYDNPGHAPRPRAPDRYDVEGWIGFLAANAGRTLRLEEMARHACLSVPHFGALFRQRTGMPPLEYHIHLRIQEACRLLDTTPLAVRAIAVRAGYDDPYYFSRVFRRVTGLSPRRYRSRGTR